MADVLAYLQKHAGEHVRLEDLIVATSYSRRQIQAAVSTTQREHKWPIATIVQGRRWRVGQQNSTIAPLDRSELGDFVPPAEAQPTSPAPVSAEPVSPPPKPVKSQVLFSAAPDAYAPTPTSADEEPKLPSLAKPVAPADRRISVNSVKTVTAAPDTFERLYEVLGIDGDGRLIIRDDQHEFYKATLEKL